MFSSDNQDFFSRLCLHCLILKQFRLCFFKKNLDCEHCPWSFTLEIHQKGISSGPVWTSGMILVMNISLYEPNWHLFYLNVDPIWRNDADVKTVLMKCIMIAILNMPVIICQQFYFKNGSIDWARLFYDVSKQVRKYAVYWFWESHDGSSPFFSLHFLYKPVTKTL